MFLKLKIISFPVMDSLEEMTKKAGVLRYWSAVRYSSSLLKQMADSISPYVTQILVSGKRVTVGTIGQCFTMFDKPLTPSEIQEAIYTNVQPFNTIAAVLQQELIIYCGKLIATHPELFSGILVVRMGWILKALELYRQMTMDNPESLDCCSPHTIRKLVFTVLSESRAIDLDFKGLKKSSVKENKTCQKFENTAEHLKNVPKLTLYNVRKLSGCLTIVPDGFYETIWHILTKVKGGIKILDKTMPQQPTITDMARYNIFRTFLPPILILRKLQIASIL